MQQSKSQFIRERCLGLIRDASMNLDSWEWTLLDGIHSPIANEIDLKPDEHPLVSFFSGDGDWTLYTTHRLIGACESKRVEILRDSFSSTSFGNFKQDLDSPRVITAKVRSRLLRRSFLYESGYASMAPINYFKFWSLKWPVWRETFRLETTRAEQVVADQRTARRE